MIPGGWDEPPSVWTTGVAWAMHVATQERIPHDLRELTPDESTLARMIADPSTPAQHARDVVCALIAADLPEGRATRRAARMLGDFARALATLGALDGPAPQRDADYDATARMLAVALAVDAVIEARVRRRLEES